MEVKPGYKQTEVGVIPEKWDCTTVRGIASSARNAIVGGPFGSDLVSADYVEAGVPVIRGQNMGGQWVSGTFVFVTNQKAKSLESNLARTGDIIFTQRGTLGQVSLIPVKPFPSYLISQSQMKLTVSRELAEPLFFFYVFTSEDQQELIRGGTIQTGVPHINLGILRGIPVQLPPLPEQRAIAEALGDVDALLGALDRLIAKKRDLKQAAMQQLLTGQTRLPGFEGEWAVAVLGDLLTMKATYGIVTAGDFKSTGVPMMRGGDIKAGQVGYDLPCVSSEKSIEYSRTILKRDDVVIALVGYPGEAAKVPTRLEGANISRAVGLLRLNNQIAPDYLASYLNSPMGRRMVLAPSAGSAQLVVNLAELNKLEFPLPPLPEQTAIAEVLSDMDAELAELERRRDKTRMIKQGMMQELLTGRTRLL